MIKVKCGCFTLTSGQFNLLPLSKQYLTHTVMRRVKRMEVSQASCHHCVHNNETKIVKIKKINKGSR